MLDFFKKSKPSVPSKLIKFEWRKKKTGGSVVVNNKKDNPIIEWRNGGDGFIKWCEDNVCLAIYHEGSTVPTWTPMRSMPEDVNPETGRSYKQMWETQKDILREALRMENGRFIYRLIVFCWMRGEGKCLDLLTKVLMFDGTIKYAKDVKIGDLLMGDDNKPREVLQLVRGKEELFEVTPFRGESFTVTGDHKLTLKRRAQIRNRNSFKKRDSGHGEITDITVNDFKKKSKAFRNSHQLFRVPIDWPEKEVPLDPYFLGIWLGDGNSGNPAITTMDREVVDYIRDFAEKENLKVSERRKEPDSKAALYSLVTDVGKNNHLLDLMREMGVINNKHIPHIYKANSREVRMNILAGILDADGYRNRNSFEIIFKRQCLAEDVAFIARSLGFHVNITETKKGIKETGFIGDYFRVGISGDCSQIPVRVERRKCEKRSDWKDVLVSGIRDIKSAGEKEYIGFMVDGNNRFLLGDFTVTHNSLIACLIQLWKFFCFPKQQIMLGANSKDQVKFVHYDIMKEIILNSPNLLKVIGAKNLQEKEMRLVDKRKRVVSIVRSISSFSGIVSNITGYTFSEIFDMKNPKFFVQLDGSIRNMPNALGVIDSTVSEKTHILYQLYENSLKKGKEGSVFFSYRCSTKGLHTDFFNPQMTQKQLDDYASKFPPIEFARYFKNLWDSGVRKVFTESQVLAMRYIGVRGKTVYGGNAITELLQQKVEKKRTLEMKKQSGLPYSDTEYQEFCVEIDKQLTSIETVYSLNTNSYYCEMARKDDLERLSELYDTNWVIGAGVDRADPLKKTTGARTITVYVAKGMPGSRSNPIAFADPDAINKFIYVILGVKHSPGSTIEEVKEEINAADEEYAHLDALCSERWGMFDILSWCEQKNIELELLSPTTDKQKEGFAELFILIVNERLKCSPIAYPGSAGKDILFEELNILESDPDKTWYGSPEKSKIKGIQDDCVFALVWAIYGLRFKTVHDMRPRVGGSFMGLFIPNKEIVGDYR